MCTVMTFALNAPTSRTLILRWLLTAVLSMQGAEIEHVLKSVMRKQVLAGQQAVLELVSL